MEAGMKLDFLVGHHELWEKHPPAKIYIFSERPEVDPHKPDLMYGWFIWERTRNNLKFERNFDVRVGPTLFWIS